MTMFTLGDVADILDNALDTGISIVDALSKLSDCADHGVLSREQCFQQLELLRSPEASGSRQKVKAIGKGTEPISRVPSESDFKKIQSKLGGIKTIVVRSSTSRAGSSAVETAKGKPKKLKASKGTRKRKPYKLKVEKVGYSSTSYGSSDAISLESLISDASTYDDKSSYQSTSDYPSEGMGSADLTTEAIPTSGSDNNDTTYDDVHLTQSSQTEVQTTTEPFNEVLGISDSKCSKINTSTEVNSQDDQFFESYYTLTGNSIRNGKLASVNVKGHSGGNKSLDVNVGSSKNARPSTFVLGTETSPEKAQMKGLPIVDALDDLCKVADELLSVCNGHGSQHDYTKEIEGGDLTVAHSSYSTDDWHLDKQIEEVENQVSSVMNTFAEIESNQLVSKHKNTANTNRRSFTQSMMSIDETDVVSHISIDRKDNGSETPNNDLDANHLGSNEEGFFHGGITQKSSSDMNLSKSKYDSNTENLWQPRARHSAGTGTRGQGTGTIKETDHTSNRGTFVLKSLKRPSTFVLDGVQDTSANSSIVTTKADNETCNSFSIVSDSDVQLQSSNGNVSKTKRPGTFVLSPDNKVAMKRHNSETRHTEDVQLSKSSSDSCRSTFVLSSVMREDVLQTNASTPEEKHGQGSMGVMLSGHSMENISSLSPKSPDAFQKLGKLYSYMSRSLTKLNEINKVCEDNNSNKVDKDVENGLSKVPEDAFEESKECLAPDTKSNFSTCLTSEITTTDVIDQPIVNESDSVNTLSIVDIHEQVDVDSIFPAPIPEIIVPPIGTSISTIVGEDQPVENLTINLFPLPVAKKITEDLVNDNNALWLVDSKKLLGNSERREAFVKCSSRRQREFNAKDSIKSSAPRSRSVDSQVRNHVSASYYEHGSEMPQVQLPESTSQISDRKLVKRISKSSESLQTMPAVHGKISEVKGSTARRSTNGIEKRVSVRKLENVTSANPSISKNETKQAIPTPIERQSNLTCYGDVNEKLSKATTAAKISKNAEYQSGSVKPKEPLSKKKTVAQARNRKMRSVSNVSEYFSSLADQKKAMEKRNRGQIYNSRARKDKQVDLSMTQQDREAGHINYSKEELHGFYKGGNHLHSEELDFSQGVDNFYQPQYAMDDMIIHLSRQRAEDRPWKLADSVFQFEELVREKERYSRRHNIMQKDSKAAHEKHTYHEKREHSRNKTYTEKSNKDTNKGRVSKDGHHSRIHQQEKNRMRARPRWMKSDMSAKQWLEIIENCRHFMTRENSGEIYFEGGELSDRPSQFDSVSSDDVRQEKKHRRKWNKPKRSYSDPVPMLEHREKPHKMVTGMSRSKTFVISPASGVESDSGSTICHSKTHGNRYKSRRPNSWTVNSVSKETVQCDLSEPSFDSLFSDSNEPQVQLPYSSDKYQQSRNEGQLTSPHKLLENPTFVFNEVSSVTDRLLKVSTRQNRAYPSKKRTSASKESATKQLVEKMVDNVMEAAIRSVPRNMHSKSKRRIEELQGNSFYSKSYIQERAMLRNKEYDQIKSMYHTATKLPQGHTTDVKSENIEGYSGQHSCDNSTISTHFKKQLNKENHNLSTILWGPNGSTYSADGSQTFNVVSSKEASHAPVTHNPDAEADDSSDNCISQQKGNILAKSFQEQDVTHFGGRSTSHSFARQHKSFSTMTDEIVICSTEKEMGKNDHIKIEAGKYVNEGRVTGLQSRLDSESDSVTPRSISDDRSESDVPERDTDVAGKEQKKFSSGYSAFIPYTKTSISQQDALAELKVPSETNDGHVKKRSSKARPSTYVLGGDSSDKKQDITSAWSSESSELDKDKVQRNFQRENKRITKRGTYVLQSSGELTKSARGGQSTTQEKPDKEKAKAEFGEMDTSKSNTKQDETDGFKDDNNLGSRLASLRMQLEERRKHIEKEKKKMVEKWNEERMKSAQNVFWLMIGKDKQNEPEASNTSQRPQRQAGESNFKPRKSWDVYVPKDEPNEADSEYSPNEDRSSKKKGLIFFPVNETKSPLAKALDLKEGAHSMNSPPMECSTPLSPQAYNQRLHNTEHHRSMHVETTTKEFMKVTNEMLGRKPSSSPQIMSDDGFSHFPLHADPKPGYTGYHEIATNYDISAHVRGASQYPLSNGSAYDYASNSHQGTATNEILVEAYQRPGGQVYEPRSPRERNNRTLVYAASAAPEWPEVAPPPRQRASPPSTTRVSPPTWREVPQNVTRSEYNSVSEMFYEGRSSYSNAQFSNTNSAMPTTYRTDTEVIATSPPPASVEIVEDTLEFQQYPATQEVGNFAHGAMHQQEQAVYQDNYEQRLSPRQQLSSTTFVKSTAPERHTNDIGALTEETLIRNSEQGRQPSPRQYYEESTTYMESTTTVMHPSESSVPIEHVLLNNYEKEERLSPREQYVAPQGYFESNPPVLHPVESGITSEEVVVTQSYHEQQESARQHHASRTYVASTETTTQSNKNLAVEEQVVNDTDREQSCNESTANDSDHHDRSSGEAFFIASSEVSSAVSDQETKNKSWMVSATEETVERVQKIQAVVEESGVSSEETPQRDSETVASEEEKATRRRSGGIALDIALSDSPSSQSDARVNDGANLAGMTPEQMKKREKFIQNRIKQQQEMKAKREAEMEKRRRKEEKMKERKEMLEKKEEEGKEKLRKRRQEEEELLRKKAEEEEALRKKEEQLWRLRHFTSTKEDMEIRRTVERFKPISHTSSSHSGSTGQLHSPEEEVPAGHGSTTFREYSGPPVYVKPSGKSNRKIIVNAISHCCLSGEVNKEAKDKCLQVLSSSDSSHFLVLFRDGLKFRGLYSYSPETDMVTKLYGVGPRHVTAKMIEHLFKYNSGGKEFTQIHAKSFSIQVDGMTIKKEFWMSAKQGVSKTNTNLKKYPSKTSLRK